MKLAEGVITPSTSVLQIILLSMGYQETQLASKRRSITWPAVDRENERCGLVQKITDDHTVALDNR